MKMWISRAMVVTGWLDRLQPLVQLLARLYVAKVFFMSGREKLSDWGATLALFHDEYKVPILPPDFAAVMGTAGEVGFSTLLALGLFGRFGAVGLFFVNAMAVLSYPQLWDFDCPAAINSHFYWGSIIAGLIAFGPGKWSLDHIALKRLGLA
jgi:putative oxidoreductase